MTNIVCVHTFDDRAEYRDSDGLLHRDDGPAVEWAYLGSGSWWEHGKRHKIGGPALVFSDGWREWWIDGKEYSEYEYWQIMWSSYTLTASTWISIYRALTSTAPV